MTTSNASAHWEGAPRTGQGAMKPGHAPEIPFSFASRFEGHAASNPEELIGAALAGCFSMALAVGLERSGATPRSIRTAASVTLDRDAEGFTITAIDLRTEVEAPGIDESAFQLLADTAKKTCPVSKALAGVPRVSLEARLVS
jgi:osmotically inducible protein OsmC